MNCPDKLTNASEYTKLNIDFQNFLGGDTPEPASWRGKEHTWEGKARPSDFFYWEAWFIPKAGLKSVRTCSAEQGPPHFRGPHTCKKIVCGHHVNVKNMEMPELALLGSSQQISRNCALKIGMTQYVYYAWCGGPIRGGDYRGDTSPNIRGGGGVCFIPQSFGW